MRMLEWAITGIGFVLALAWLFEAFLVGRGFVSIYLGPVALVLIATGVILRRRRRPR